MKNNSFLDKVVQSLLLQNFQVDSNAYTYGLVRGKNDSFSGKVIDSIDITKSVLTIAQFFGSPIDSDCADFKTIFNEEGFKKDLKTLYSITDAVLYKFIIGQPLIVGVIKADSLTHNEICDITDKFDKAILGFRKYTARMKWVKMSVTGILIFLFYDKDKAANYCLYELRNCKRWHFWKKTWILGWSIDISSKKIIRHKGIPFFIGPILDTKKLEKDLFEK